MTERKDELKKGGKKQMKERREERKSFLAKLWVSNPQKNAQSNVFLIIFKRKQENAEGGDERRVLTVELSTGHSNHNNSYIETIVHSGPSSEG